MLSTTTKQAYYGRKKTKGFAAKFAKGVKTEADPNQFMQMLTKLMVETALNVELTEHLGHDKNTAKSGSQTRITQIDSQILSLYAKGMTTRGIQDILIACIDGLKGFPDAINSVCPQTQIQLCIIHMVRNSLKYISWKDYKAVGHCGSENSLSCSNRNFCLDSP